MLAFLVCLWIVVPLACALAFAAAPSVDVGLMLSTLDVADASDALVTLRTARSLFAAADATEAQIALAVRYGRRDALTAQQGRMRAAALRRHAWGMLLTAGVAR